MRLFLLAALLLAASAHARPTPSAGQGPPPPASVTPSPDGFAAHLRDAIRLNHARRARYAALSGGRSLAVSDELLRAERLLLPAARLYDALARPYQRRGIGLLVDEFVPMADAPAFAPRLDAPPAPSDPVVSARDARRLAQRGFVALHRHGYDALAETLSVELAALERVPALNAMTRHLLESARRAARLAPRHARAAEAAGLPSPAWLTVPFVAGHLLALPLAARLDRRAAPLQRRGLPILVRDLPPIPDL